MLAWLLVCATALADDVVVRQDTPLRTPWVIEAQGRASGPAAGVSTIVLPALPGTTDDLWVLSGGALAPLPDASLRRTANGALVADWVATGGYATLSTATPTRATLWLGGEVIDAVWLEPLWFPPAGGGGHVLEAGCVTTCGDGAWCSGGVCACTPGYAGPPTACIDIDECPDACGPNSVCTNLPGSFACACAPGFAWAGAVCANVDECALDLDDCDPRATCADTDGAFTCACPAGFDGDGRTCTDRDECALGEDDCALQATCTNVDGGFTCACPDGWTGDGRSCTPPPDPCDPDPCATGEVCTADGTAARCDCLPGWAPQNVGCAPVCGDGQVALGAEACDDGNLDPGDGCSPTCTVEDGWVCDPTGCLPDRDLDGVPDEVDVCPDDWDPEQLDADGDGVGDACADADSGEPLPEGCGCQTTPAAPWGLLFVPLLLGARRRREKRR